MRSTCLLTILCLSLVGTHAIRVGNVQVPTWNPHSDHVLIYQYSKVGSTSVQDELGKMMRPPVHIPWVADVQDKYRRGAKIHKKEAAADFLAKTPAGSNTWVITMTRNPFARSISGFFQNLATDRDFVKGRTQDDVLKMDIKNLHNEYRNRSASDIDVWFSQEFQNVTGVNMLNYAHRVRWGAKNNHIFVEHSMGRKSLKIILLRFEEIGNWQQTLEQYFPGFVMPDHNVGTEKWYAPVYKDFEKSYIFNKEESERMCNGETMSFYSEEEKLAMAPQCHPNYHETDHTGDEKPIDRFDKMHKRYVDTPNARFLLSDMSVEALDDE